MAATGDDATAMDSISRVPAAHAVAPNLTAGAVGHTEGLEDAADSPASAPRKPHTNSESTFPPASAAY